MNDFSGSTRVDEVLDQALALPPEQRAAFVAEAAGADEALRAAVERVLAETDRTDGFLAPGGALTGPVFDSWCERFVSDADSATLQPGARVGPYEVVERIGRGGMGEVYRARDGRLGREVALKVLPSSVANDPARLARFEREARVLASLSHPAIAAIYHLDETSDVKALVLELVEGPTLADRLAEGPLALADTLSIGRRITEALEAAHERGIVHRDLKPANIKISPEAGVKVLDFGLARAFDVDGGPQPLPALASLTEAGQPGAIVGTAAYMSPEQARGQRVDHRTDIWAFGCVLYEMLTGRRAFSGESATEVIARVLERDPDLDRLPPGTPASVRRLLRRAFEKDPARRLRHIADARLEIDEATGDAVGPDRTEGPGASVERRRLARGVSSIWPVAAALVVGMGVAGAWFLWTRPPAAPQPIARLAVPVPPGDEVVAGQMPSVAVSPDGRHVVYRARRDGTIRLFLRSLDHDAPMAIPGSEEAASPFFSPDGRWIGFDRDGVIMKAPLDGGPPARIADLPGGFTAAWRDDGTIVVASAQRRGLLAVSDAGGPLEPFSVPDDTASATTYAFPETVPRTDAVLLTVGTQDSTRIAVLQPGAASPRVLLEGSQPRLVDSGRLVFVRNGALWAVGFDTRRLAPWGQPVTVQTAVRPTSTGGGHFSVGRDGTLVFLPARATAPARTLRWVAHGGAQTPLDLEARAYSRATLSPEGDRIAFSVSEGGNQDIWIHDLRRGTTTRVTFDPAVDTAPLWSPDGRSVVFRSDRADGGLFLASPDASMSMTRLTAADGAFLTPYSFTPDGRTLLFSAFRTYREQGIGAVDLNRPGEARTVLDGPFAELRPQLSPDGRWMAYQSDESGQFEVYVRPYPNVTDRRWTISSGGGTSPVWSRDGRTLYYYNGRAIAGVDVDTAATGLVAGSPRTIAEVALYSERLGPVFDLAPDGRRFLVVLDEDEARRAAQGQVMLVRHWESSARD